MDTIKFVEITNPLTEETTEHVIIDHGNNEFTSMPKAIWDELNADSEGNK